MAGGSSGGHGFGSSNKEKERKRMVTFGEKPKANISQAIRNSNTADMNHGFGNAKKAIADKAKQNNAKKMVSKEILGASEQAMKASRMAQEAQRKGQNTKEAIRNAVSPGMNMRRSMNEIQNKRKQQQFERAFNMAKRK